MPFDFMEWIKEWRIYPYDESYIINGEEAVAYISTEMKYKFAIYKDGQYVDSFFMVGRHHSHPWRDYMCGQKFDHDEVIRIMLLRAELRKIGWVDERPYDECDDIIMSSVQSDCIGEFERKMYNRNYYSLERDHIVLLAIEAYLIYKSLYNKKTFRPRKCSKPFCSDEVMRLALYVALLNPSLGRRWCNGYNNQGARGLSLKQDELDVTLNYLSEYKIFLQLQDEFLDEYGRYLGHDEFDVWSKDDRVALNKVLDKLKKDRDLIIKDENVQIEAVKAVKAKLTSMEIPCKTNVMEQPWAQFVAAAWGVLPSQVVSAAKTLNKLESQEQK